MNLIAQGAALYSANPISSVLEDQIECARAHSRGAVDYDKIVRGSLYSDGRSQGSISPARIRGSNDINSSHDHFKSQLSPNRVVT